MSNEEGHFYEFDEFRIDTIKRRLLRAGEIVQLTPKAFDLLLALVDQSGRTIEKDDLIEQVWPETAVEENNLTQNISTLRKALGDSAAKSRYITTIPGIGYRFVAEVKKTPLEDKQLIVTHRQESRIVVEEIVEQDEPPLPAPSRGNTASLKAIGESAIISIRLHKRMAALILAFVIVAIAAAAWWVYKHVAQRQRELFASHIEATLLTRIGLIGRAAVSPDGKYVVYYSLGEDGRESLWLRQVAASSSQQIIPPAKVLYHGLAFSRDGNHIYFVREDPSDSTHALYRMPALGGIPARLLVDIATYFAVSPDDSRIAFVRLSPDESALMIANSDGSDVRKIAARPVSEGFKVAAFSPDGKLIACSVGNAESLNTRNTVVAVRVEDGAEMPLTQQAWTWTGWVEWLSDGSGLLITAREGPGIPDQIWHIAYPSGAARKITNNLKAYYSLSLTADSRSLVAVQTELQSDIWINDAGRINDAGGFREVTSGSGAYGDVALAPDGRIVYASQASGYWDLWIMKADGTDQRQLTADASVNGEPTFSPDGRFIVFSSGRKGVINIWRINSDGTNPVRLTVGDGERFPQNSPDGKWVVYSSVVAGEHLYSLWKMPAGGGEAVQLAAVHSGKSAVSPDGKWIAFFRRDDIKRNHYKLVVIPFEGGPPAKTFDTPQGILVLPRVHWSTDGKALTYSAFSNGSSNIWAQALDGAPAKQLTDFKYKGNLLFDWSRDGKQLVISRREWVTDLVLLSNFK